MDHEYIKFDRDSKVSESHDEFKFYIYTLEEPLQPGDSMKMNFKLNYVTKGFKESAGASNTGIVYNGTFLNNGQFPSLGYSEGNELSSDNDRKDHDLEPKNRSMSREDPRGLKSNFISDDSHGINFEIVIGTEPDQIAIAPGYIQREWEDKGRKYYHYKMDQPMMPFFNIVSARYEVMRDRTTIKNDTLEKDINLEIYYHKGHEYNLESMMKGMKESFAYFSNNFSPYQFQQMRILEFPRYATFAQSFANTVPFSEGIGFMLKIEDEDDVDIAFYVTAHELAHQWWGHQLFPANVQGAAALSESLSQYSALMVMKQAYPEQHIREFLKQELDRYLSGRATETKREMPLSMVESQAYIHYGKGANVMYALQDYIGEDSVNIALQRLVRDFRTFEQNGRYATTKDLVKNLREVTPDSMQYIITDMFDKIILFENKVESATYTPKGEKYSVTIDLEAKKLEADTIGVENPVTLTDWIDVGVYSKDEDGEDKLIYLKKHLFNQAETKIEIEVDEEPIKVGIDPLHKLIDRNPEDNIKAVTESEAS